MCDGGILKETAGATLPAAIGAAGQIFSSQNQPSSNIGSINPASLQSPQEQALLNQQVAFSQAVTPLEQAQAQSLIPLQQQFQETAIPLATQQLPQLAALEGSQLGLGQTLAEGGQLPGMFGGLGQGLGSSEAEQAQFGRINENVRRQQESIGGLTTGATAELLQQQLGDIAIANQTQQRNELLQLLNLARG